MRNADRRSDAGGALVPPGHLVAHRPDSTGARAGRGPRSGPPPRHAGSRTCRRCLRMARPAPRLVLTPASLFLKRAHLRQRVALLVKEASMSKARLACAVVIMAVVVFIGGRLAASAVPLQRVGEPQPVVSRRGTGRGTAAAAVEAGHAAASTATAATWHPEAVRVGGAIKPPARIVDVRAVYPEVARAAKVQGVVICEILVGPDGKVAGRARAAVDSRCSIRPRWTPCGSGSSRRRCRMAPRSRSCSPSTVNFTLSASGSLGDAGRGHEWHPEAARVGGDVRPPTKTRRCRCRSTPRWRWRRESRAW